MFSKSALLFLALVGAFVIVRCEEKYSDKYDHVNVEAVLANPRQRQQYYKCFSGEGACLTPDAKFFQQHLREAIVTHCQKCTDRQKAAFEKITDYYVEHEPEKYRAIVAKAIEDARKH